MWPVIPHIDQAACAEYAETLPTTSGVYIICYPDINPGGERYGHCAHYLGSASNIRARYLQHISGTGANVIRVSNERNGDIVPELHYWPTMTAEDAREIERIHKRKLKDPARYCPSCGWVKLSLDKPQYRHLRKSILAASNTL